jgi:hypothetical protein
MKKKNKSISKIICFLVMCLTVGVLSAHAMPPMGNFKLDGYLLNESAFMTSEHKWQKIRNVLNVNLTYQFSENARAFLQVRPIYDAAFSVGADRGIMGRHNMDFNWHDEAWYDYEPIIREGWVEFQTGNFYARIGKQLVTWGTADGFRLMDQINTLNYRDFIKPADQDYKIPNAMLNLNYRFNTTTSLQFLIIPRFIHALLPPVKHPYAFNVSYAFADFENAMKGLSIPVKYDNPATSWGDASYGLRLASRIEKINLDYTLNWLKSYDSLPVLVPNGPIIPGLGLPEEWKYMHNRLNMWGATFSYNIPGLTCKQFLQGDVLRGEFAYIRKAAFTNTAFAVEKKDTVNFLIGYDKYFPWRIGPSNRDWWFSAQYKAVYLCGTGALPYLNGALGEVGRWENQYTLLVMTDWLANRLSLYWLTVGTEHAGVWTFPQFTWEFTDKFRGTLGYYYVTGPRTDIVGEYRDNDTVEFRLKYDF